MQNQGKGQSLGLEDSNSGMQRKTSVGQVQSQPHTPAPTPPTQSQSPTKKGEGDSNGNDQNGEDSNQARQEGTTTIAGMRVTLLDLTKEEKDSVVAKVILIHLSWSKSDQPT
jgi:hypothetical protein